MQTNAVHQRAGQARHRHLPWLLALFVGSGCAALIYEIVWLQLLQLVIGLTNVSLGLLLGIFMGGMCLGSLLLPRLISQRRHPLKVYALLEIGIAVFGVAILFVVPWLSSFYTAHAGPGLSGVLLRGGLVALCLLPPTICMGATLPAIARWIEITREGVSWMGFFYGGNIVGAVGGCLLAGFYLLRVFDMAVATYVAAAINGVVATVALVLAAKSESDDAGTDVLETSTAESAAHNPFSRGGIALSQRRWPVYVTIALSGMAALGAEVVWTRLLSLLMGGTVYTFSIILAVFLVGLGIGSTAGSFLARSLERPRLVLAGCQFLLMLAVAWGAVSITQSLPYWPLDPSLSTNPWFNFQLDLARGLWAVLPASILWGASFPLALAALAAPGQDSGRMVGGVYAANTVGAIVGALLFSLVIVPNAGTLTAQRALIAVSALAALVAAGKRVRIPAFAIGTPALAVILIWNVSPAPWGLAAFGRFMATYGGNLHSGILAEKDVPRTGNASDVYCTYVGEGLNGTVAVTMTGAGVRSFHSAGKVQASNDPLDMRLQRMLGHLSALVHEKPESVLVVACGAGVTAGSFVTHPETKRIVICDIEPLVPQMIAPMFAAENFDVVHDPRTEVVSDDGRHFIRTTHEKFDVITSDPIDPWVKGCAALNTVEYYEMCKARLNPGGVMSLWIPLYESNPTTVRSIIATFFKVFPNGVLWSNDDRGDGYDAVLFGQAEPTRIDVDQMEARLNRPDHARVKKSLADAGFLSAEDLLATYAGQAADMQDWMSVAQINTDANLRLQYLAGWSVNSFMGKEILKGIVHYQKFPDLLFNGSEKTKLRLKARLRKLVKTAEGNAEARNLVKATQPMPEAPPLDAPAIQPAL